MDFTWLRQPLEQGTAVHTHTLVLPDGSGRCFAPQESLPFPAPASDGLFSTPEGRIYRETWQPAPALAILGGGHVGRALSRLGVFLGYRVTVYDDRAGILRPEDFPGAALCHCDYARLDSELPRDAGCSYVVLTSGHRGDFLCTLAVLRRPFAYAGMIGSKNKVSTVQRELAAAGVPREKIAALHAPIGLPIGAQTPEEIAVSIAGELIAGRRGAPAGVEGRLLAALTAPGARGTLVTVAEKKGSAPRGPGSRMLVLPDGTALGTVGGGVVEAAAIRDAQTTPGYALRRYVSRSRKGEVFGPACGGEVELLFTPVCNGTEAVTKAELLHRLLPRLGKVTAVIGGGGKTTLVYTLAEALAARGERVLVTTTTHMAWPPRSDLPEGVTVGGTQGDAPHKMDGLPAGDYPQAERDYDRIVVEADGAHCLPLKWHRGDEPVIPPDTDCLLIVAGLSGLSRPAGEVLHRQGLSPLPPEHLMTAEDLAMLTRRGLEKAGTSCPAIAVYNQLDTLPAGAPLPQPGLESYAVSLKGE